MTVAQHAERRPSVGDWLADASAVRILAAVLAAALLTSVFAHIRVPLPFTPVPIVGTTFAVLVSGAALGPRWGAASQVLYLSFGVLGLPLFAGGAAGGTGVAVLLGPSGGYFLGFVIAAWAVGHLTRCGWNESWLGVAASFGLATLIVYALGVIWLIAAHGYGFGEVLLVGVLPFLVGDAAKGALAAATVPHVRRRLVGITEG